MHADTCGACTDPGNPGRGLRAGANTVAGEKVLATVRLELFRTLLMQKVCCTEGRTPQCAHCGVEWVVGGIAVPHSSSCVVVAMHARALSNSFNCACLHALLCIPLTSHAFLLGADIILRQAQRVRPDGLDISRARHRPFVRLQVRCDRLGASSLAWMGCERKCLSGEGLACAGQFSCLQAAGQTNTHTHILYCEWSRGVAGSAAPRSS
eukprot:365028-Chlamydomonas_euryale.AAC.3